MIPLGNSIPLIFLGAITGTFVLLLIYHIWSRRSRLQSDQHPRDEEQQQADGEFVTITMVKRTAPKKAKIPKMWDVRIPNMSESRGDLSQPTWDDYFDEDGLKDMGRWNTIKPMSVAYIKHSEYSGSTLSSPSHSSQFHDDDNTRINAPSKLASLVASQRRDKPDGDRQGGNYDKSTIEAVQVSVLISMPKNSGGEGTAGPLALGVAKVALDDERRWKRRPTASAV